MRIRRKKYNKDANIYEIIRDDKCEYETKLLELNCNAKGIQNINKLIADNIKDMSERDAKMKDFMLDLWKTMIQIHTEI